MRTILHTGQLESYDGCPRLSLPEFFTRTDEDVRPTKCLQFFPRGVYLGQRHGFVTVVLDLDSRAIVSVLKGRGKPALKPFFSKLKQARAKNKAVATDMSGGYIAAVMENLPQAALVFDRFHVVKLMNENSTDLRREMYHELTDKQHRKMLKEHATC